MIKLENWSVMQSNSNPYLPPEARPTVLVGTVYGHPNRPDGDRIRTSSLMSISYSKRKAKTRNTEYTLGEPEAEFLKFLEEAGSSVEKYEFESL